jgi:hypothetical protein
MDGLRNSSRRCGLTWFIRQNVHFPSQLNVDKTNQRFLVQDFCIAMMIKRFLIFSLRKRKKIARRQALG